MAMLRVWRGLSCRVNAHFGVLMRMLRFWMTDWLLGATVAHVALVAEPHA